jgi:GTP-binding protein
VISVSLPLVAIVGRPNVGKSTLVNRVAAQPFAIVDKESGITRDRNYVETDWAGRSFTLIDTGGLDFGEKGELIQSVREQALIAIEEADVILMVVDARTGPLASDREAAEILRRSGKPTILLVNKLDDPGREDLKYSFYELALGEPRGISALHGIGIGDILDELITLLPEAITVEETREVWSIAIVGRPNVGKSSLFNVLLGEERAIVSEVPGTTRDAIDTIIERDHKFYRYIDTAGLRKRARIGESVEYYGMVRTLRALGRARVALLILDAEAGATEQDQKIAGYAESRGCATIVVINKWDLVPKEVKERQYVESVRRKLHFLDYAPITAMSVLTGIGVKKIYPLVDKVILSHSKKIGTPELNKFVREIAARGHTLARRGKTLKLYYATQVGTAPPRFLFFANHPEIVDSSYMRYLEGKLRGSFGFSGTPIRIAIRKK